MPDNSRRMVIDADSHVTEPEDLFTSRVSSKWGDLVLHVQDDEENGEDAWYIGDVKVAAAWGSASQGCEHLWPPYPKRKADVLPAAYDSTARLALLDRENIHAQVLYPNVAGFGGGNFLKLKEPALMLECCRAYNDFLNDFASVAPDRFIKVAALPFWDIDQAVPELHRAAAAGHKGILFSGSPHELGMPYLADPHWDPIWAAAQEAGLPVSFHLGSGDMMKIHDPVRAAHEGRGCFIARVPTAFFMDIGGQLNDLLFSGILPRFPELKFVMAESGLGAVPFILESADYHFSRSELRQEKAYFKELPSYYFGRQVSVTHWFENASQQVIESIGVDNVMFETDFPHPTSLRENEILERVRAIEEQLPEPSASKVLHDNAANIYNISVPTPA